MTSNGKISLRQVMLIFLAITFTPALRTIPSSTASISKQAAWLAPVISFVLLLPVIFALKSIYKKYQDKSFTEILEVVFGRLIGKIVTFVYILFFIMLLAINTRGISEKLVCSMYPSVKPAFFIIGMLVIIGYCVYKGGLTVIVRMGEIILPFLMVVFLLLCSLAGPNVQLSRITPISYLDIVPVLKSSFVVCGVQAHLPMLFLLSNHINNKDKIGKNCTSAALVYMFLTIVLLVTIIGSLGAETTADAPLSFITTVKLISLFDSIERIEPLVVSLWIFTDFLLISVLLISLLNMYRSLFELSKTKNFIIINLFVVYFLAMMLGRNMFEVQLFLKIFLIPMMIFWGFLLPLVVYFTGKVRKLL